MNLKNKMYRFFFFLFCLPFQLFSVSVPESLQGPWLTGPLLAPSGHAIPYHHTNYEPYFYWTEIHGRYDKNWEGHSRPTFTQAIIQPTFQWGILPRVEFDIAPTVLWNHTQGQSKWCLADNPIVFGIQLLNDQPGKWWPAIKWKLAFFIPTGKYQRLDPKKKRTDLGGTGSLMPGTALVFSRLFHFSGAHYLAARYYIAYFMPTPVHVKGFNAYGGAKHTHGTAYPGNMFLTILGLEYTLNKNWVLASDIQYQHFNKTRFSGRHGKDTAGQRAKVGGPSQEQISIAPAIEYNWNEWAGVIGGAWFTIAGRNSVQFLSWVFAINIYV